MRKAYAECNLNKKFAEVFLKELKIEDVKLAHKSNMNVEEVIRRMDELRLRNKKGELWAFFPDKEKNVRQAVLLEKAVNALMKRAERMGMCCRRSSSRSVEVVVCRGKGGIIVVSFKGGIEEALRKAGGLREGDVQRHLRSLKRGELSGPFHEAFNALVKEAVSITKRLWEELQAGEP